MPDIRPINENKYGISKHRFKEIYHFCMQYNEWIDELKYKTSTVKSKQITDMPICKGGEDATQNLAIERAELRKKCEIVEQAAIEADADIYEYILKAVTNERISYKYLKQVMSIPCEKDMYYDRRRKFYYIMSTKI